MTLVNLYTINNFVYYKQLRIIEGDLYSIVYEVSPVYEYPLRHFVYHTMGHYTKLFIVYEMRLYQYPLIRVSAYTSIRLTAPSLPETI